MEPPAAQNISKSFQLEEDERERAINEWYVVII